MKVNGRWIRLIPEDNQKKEKKNIARLKQGAFYELISTRKYENRANKHFVIFLNFPCLTACLLYSVVCLCRCFFFLLVLRLGICVEVDVDKNYYLPTPSLPPYFFFFLLLFFSFYSLFNTSDSYLKSVRA